MASREGGARRERSLTGSTFVGGGATAAVVVFQIVEGSFLEFLASGFGAAGVGEIW